MPGTDMRVTRMNAYTKRGFLLSLALMSVWLLFRAPPKTSKRLQNSRILDNRRYHAGNVSDWCHVVDLTTEMNAEFQCRKMDHDPPVDICYYDFLEDPIVSGHLSLSGSWEPDVLKKFQEILRTDPELALIDVGANVGVYTLVAAAMGRHIVAIEPSKESIDRLHKAAQMGRYEDQITLLQCALSNKRGRATLDIDDRFKSNAVVKDVDPEKVNESQIVNDGKHFTGTIHMDDVTRFCSFQKAVIKLDIQGDEHRALAKARQLFQHIHISAVFMDWELMASTLRKAADDVGHKTGSTRSDVISISAMTQFMQEMEFVPHVATNNTELSYSQWQHWPRDVLWKKTTRDLL